MERACNTHTASSDIKMLVYGKIVLLGLVKSLVTILSHLKLGFETCITEVCVMQLVPGKLSCFRQLCM